MLGTEAGVCRLQVQGEEEKGEGHGDPSVGRGAETRMPPLPGLPWHRSPHLRAPGSPHPYPFPWVLWFCTWEGRAGVCAPQGRPRGKQPRAPGTASEGHVRAGCEMVQPGPRAAARVAQPGLAMESLRTATCPAPTSRLWLPLAWQEAGHVPRPLC